MSKLVTTKCRRAPIALSVASRLFHIARLARIARWSMVSDDAGNSRRRIIRPQSLAVILLSSSTIFLQSSYLWRLSQKILKIKVPPENCHLNGNLIVSQENCPLCHIYGNFPHWQFTYYWFLLVLFVFPFSFLPHQLDKLLTLQHYYWVTFSGRHQKYFLE